jgi:hypothetical protein
MTAAARPPTEQLISLHQQAAAVERAAVNWRGHVNTLRDLAARGKRPRQEYDMAMQWLPDLEAAAKTMRKIATPSKGT